MPRRRRRPARYSTSFHPPRFMMRHGRPALFVWSLPAHYVDRECNRVIGPPITEVKPYLYVVQEDDTDGAGAIPEKFGLEPVAGFAELRRANADADFRTDEHGTCSFQQWYAGKKVRIPASWPEPPPGIKECCTVEYGSGNVGFTLIEKELEAGPRAILPARRLEGDEQEQRQGFTLIEKPITPGPMGILPARKLGDDDGDVGFTLLERRLSTPHKVMSQTQPEPEPEPEPEQWGSQNMNEWKGGVIAAALRAYSGPYPDTVVDPSRVEQYLRTWPSSRMLQSFIHHYASTQGLQHGLYEPAAWMYLLWRYGIEVHR